MYLPFRGLLNEWQYILVFMSIASMILGAVAAIGQKILKGLWPIVQLDIWVMQWLE